MKRCKYLTIVLAAVFMAGTAAGYVTNGYELEGNINDLSCQPVSNDLAQTQANTNYVESGGFYLAAWPNCKCEMLFNATDSNNGYGPGAGGLFDAGIIFQDYATAVVRTDFPSPMRIDEIRIYSGHEHAGLGSSRAFVNCGIYFSQNGTDFTQLVVPNSINSSNAHTTFIGDWISNYPTGHSNVLTRVYDTTGGALASNVRSLRYTFYTVGFGGQFQPQPTAEGTIAFEIDVIGIPEPACALLAVVGLAFLRRR